MDRLVQKFKEECEKSGGKFLRNTNPECEFGGSEFNRVKLGKITMGVSHDSNDPSSEHVTVMTENDVQFNKNIGSFDWEGRDWYSTGEYGVIGSKSDGDNESARFARRFAMENSILGYNEEGDTGYNPEAIGNSPSPSKRTAQNLMKL